MPGTTQQERQMTTSLTDVASDTVSESRHMPMLGIIPRSKMGRFFLGWAFLNLILAMLPVFDILGNGSQIVFGVMPMTIFYCYVIYTMNCVFGLIYYFLRGSAWSALHAAGREGAAQ